MALPPSPPPSPPKPNRMAPGVSPDLLRSLRSVVASLEGAAKELEKVADALEGRG